MSEKDKKDSKDKKPRKGTDEELGEISYTYWKRESDLQADHKGFQPEKVSSPQVSQNTEPQKNQIGSAWNKAGTWEEKPISKKQFEDFFNDYLKKNEKKYKNVFALDEIYGYSGEVSLIY